MKNLKIATSMLSCDFSKLGEETKKISEAGADLIHLDIMDGIFVPNITIGPCVVKSIRKYTDIPFDVHLMINNPFDYIDDFCNAGADIITFHIESQSDIKKTLQKIKNHNVKTGISLKPDTPIEEVFDYLEDVYMILIMTVEPGFGGQTFLSNMMHKVKKLKEEIKKRNLDVLIEVDGGINSETAKISRNNGVDICVAGSYIFKAHDYNQIIHKLKKLS